jgi:hypothetical protein
MNKQERINQSKEMREFHSLNRHHNEAIFIGYDKGKWHDYRCVAIALARIGKIWHDYRINYAQKSPNK